MPMFQSPMPRRPAYGVAGPSAAPAAPAPSGGLFSGLDQFRQQNPGVLAQFGASLMARSPAAPGMAQAAQMMQVNQQKNATAKYLLDKGLADTPEEAAMLASNPQLMSTLFKDNLIQDQYEARRKIAESLHMDPNDPNTQQYMLSGQFKAGGAGGQETWGVTPIWGKNAKGEDVVGVTSDQGNFKPLNTGADFMPQGSGDKAYDRSYRGGLGKNLAEADANYKSITSKMPGLESVVTELRGLADKATYTGAGKLLDAGINQLGLDPRESAVARTAYEAKVNNQILPLLRITFGAQFTENEGVALRKTMGDPDKTPAEKQAVLDAFIEQKRRDVEAMATEAGISGGGQTIPPPGGNTRLRFNPATRDLE